MTHKIAVAVIHGIGRQEPSFAAGIIAEVKKRFADAVGAAGPDVADALVMEPVYWAPVLQTLEDELWARVSQSRDLDFVRLRQFMVSFAADAIAYQPVPREREAYDNVHAVVAQTLGRLAAAAGPDAPLCIVAHSLGTVIASNYIYDLQTDRTRRGRRRLIAPRVRALIGRTALERGETFASFYTFGCPIALWSLRYKEFGTPIQVPAPALAAARPGVAAACQWVNFYDPDDVIAYPLQKLNPAYGQVVTEDRAVNAGGLLSSWNPLSHNGYWTDNAVTKPIAAGLARLWQAANR